MGSEWVSWVPLRPGWGRGKVSVLGASLALFWKSVPYLLSSGEKAAWPSGVKEDSSEFPQRKKAEGVPSW